MKPTALHKLSRPAFVAIGAASLLVGTACRSTSITSSTTTHPVGRTTSQPGVAKATLGTNPRSVVVRDFAFDVADLHSSQGPLAGREGPANRVLGRLQPEETPVQKATRFAGLLSETIAKELADLKVPASREAPGVPLPTNGLVVSGQFMQVDEGNRLRRAIVGFGAGSTEVLVQVEVYDLMQSHNQPILVYGTGNGSKPMPGAVVSMNPYVMAAKYVMSRNATEKDLRKLGKQIANDLVQVEAGGFPRR